MHLAHARVSLSVLHCIRMQMSIWLFIWMHWDVEKCVSVHLCVCDINVCSLCSPCCSAPTVPLGPICLPVINSSGLTMQRFMTLFGLTNYHTPLPLSAVLLSLRNTVSKNNICPWLLNPHSQPGTVRPLYCLLYVSCLLASGSSSVVPMRIINMVRTKSRLCSVSASLPLGDISVQFLLLRSSWTNFPALCQF